MACSLTLTFLRERFAAQVARKSVVLVVCSHVRLHVALLRKTLATDGTGEGLLLRVHRTDMCLQVS